MIEVTFWWSGSGGDGYNKYLIDVPTDAVKPNEYFKAYSGATAIRRALSEFEKEHKDWRIQRVEVRDTPDKMLQP